LTFEIGYGLIFSTITRRLFWIKPRIDKRGVAVPKGAKKNNGAGSAAVLCIIAACVFLPSLAAAAEQSPWPFHSLKKMLVADGFDKNTIDRLYAGPGIAFVDDIAGSYFRHSEARLNYKQFTSEKSIQKARAYIASHDAELTRAQRAFGVDKTIITAILLVETRLGTCVGKNPIFNTLSTLASLKSRTGRDILWRSQADTLSLSRREFDQKALGKAAWAYTELKAFLKYTASESLDPFMINGSYAGAVGFSQFMPSNILRLGIDGDSDGTINLFTHADAIHSIANYLKYHGWKPGMQKERAFKVIYHYNHSKVYANTVLEISDLLKG
jgi:membrane-bound lytic murein transglycosylase B